MILIGDHTFPIIAKTFVSRFRRQIKVLRQFIGRYKFESNFEDDSLTDEIKIW